MKDHNDNYLRKIADGCQGEKRAELAKAELVARLRQRRADAGPGHPLAALRAAGERGTPIYEQREEGT